ncbi:MAG: hypothetical protein JST54_33070 [Deltaproteobacteria bacterium]|nr:hypothetical protein [Deltaproteobacteria bacterium]
MAWRTSGRGATSGKLNWDRMGSSVKARVAATMLLGLQAFALSRAAAGPSAAACTCTHGPDVPCGCPMHAAPAAPTVDESKLPPCHRHKLHANPASKPAPSNGPCFRAGCEMPEPALTFFLLVGLPEVQGLELEHPQSEAVAIVQSPPDAPLLARAKPPPRQDV